jgi:RsmE family RNA methyltransferase
VLIGPEGGWSEAERSLARATVGLGTTVLRAETAAIAAGVLLAAARERQQTGQIKHGQ